MWKWIHSYISEDEFVQIFGTTVREDICSHCSIICSNKKDFTINVCNTKSQY